MNQWNRAGHGKNHDASLEWTLPPSGRATPDPASGTLVCPSIGTETRVRYAEDVTKAITWLLERGDEQAVSFRQQFATHTVRASPSVPLILRLWINGGGSVSRVEFAPFTDIGMNKGLRALIVGQNVGVLPPNGTRQPMNIAIQLAENKVANALC